MSGIAPQHVLDEITRLEGQVSDKDDEIADLKRQLKEKEDAILALTQEGQRYLEAWNKEREQHEDTHTHVVALAGALEHGINVCKYPNVLEKGELAYAKQHMEEVLDTYRQSQKVK